ncbi:hybrid sensor histidine kinase/response regulator [Vibrio fluvialis]|uniref:histidine kinase n=1 Tax=Vibrio fluvialis TaxID=676 RepID=A0AAX2LN38_VIBFL|nr:ATP-binding protein [Vibrio fluvialis]AMF96146.1 hybrid sensor histidine kinase/response regulator [Vibrio fluvialis]EKO4008293.1 hybrid sensor histidine kinase/response regulator [Vibrio fluvialis]MBY8181931.1 response regulator [Vibrio fluvialis]MBY8227434.1 response regulator [Vibrio fluvialis]MCE7632813.1 ATP-binding protein [Vibrio fluvialis]
MEQEKIEQLNEALVELERSKEREQRLAEENRVILAALSALSHADNKYQIFEELKKVLSRYIRFDDFIVISKQKESRTFSTYLASNLAFQGKDWFNGDKFQRVLDGECIILFEPSKLEEFRNLNHFLKDQINSALVTGIRAQTSDSVLLLLGTRKGQFSLETKSTLSRFRPLLERAINDIEHKEALQKLVDLKTRELKIAQQQAEQANQSKSQFLAMMSHELRTPLNAVLGLIDLLRDDSDAYQQEMLEQMENSAELLLVIINDILDLSRIESGHFELQRHWISLSKKLQHALEYHSQVAQAKDIKFNVKASICEQFEYWVDSVRLTQILFNIIGNAIKFTHQGFVDVSLVTARDRLEIEVRDSGIGIDNERIEHLFSPFIQADTSITRNYGGTGLGLAITKHLVELMGGTIKVNSKLGEGSLFTISIPLESRSTAAANENAGQLSDTKTYDALDNSKHILVVEDTKTNQMVIQLLLNRMGYNVTIANNGQHAIELIERNRSFDLIFMDISMPIMDGIQATRILRSQRLTTPIIALTAHSMNSDHQNCLAAGMNDIVLKPIRSKELQRISDRYLNRR